MAEIDAHSKSPLGPPPDPRFVEFLEWQIASEQRRISSFASSPLPVPTSRKVSRMFGYLAIIVSSLLIGAAGAYTAVQIDETAHRELLQERGRIRVEQARITLDVARAEYDETEKLFRNGAVSDTDVLELRVSLAHADAELKQRALDLEEMTLTGVAPRDDLAAPLVNGRDFVLMRLNARLEQISSVADTSRQRYERIEAMVANGVVSVTELDHVRFELRRSETVLEGVARRIELREAVRKGTVAAPVAELQAMAEDATASLEVARHDLERHATVLERLEMQYAAGSIRNAEVRRTKLEVRKAEMRLRLAQAELDYVRNRLERAERDNPSP